MARKKNQPIMRVSNDFKEVVDNLKREFDEMGKDITLISITEQIAQDVRQKNRRKRI